MEKTLPNQRIEDDTTRATAHLPGLDIEIIHRGSPGAEAEQISINLQAVPSFEAQNANGLAFSRNRPNASTDNTTMSASCQ
jgi:hypothetical protein